jgi:hypothetical protein
MAAEIIPDSREITLSDRELLEVIARDLAYLRGRLDHFEPVLAQFSGPVAAYTAARRARRAARHGGTPVQ